MFCTFHPINDVVAQCEGCERALCQHCAHRIKGNAYCQECILTGIELLKTPAANQLPATTASLNNSKHSPVLATLLALIPGLGAAYNGQPIKALIHFSLPVGFWLLADVFTRPMGWAFLTAGLALYCFTILNAYVTAQQLRTTTADALRKEDDALRLFIQLHLTQIGAVLVAFGGLMLLNQFFPLQIESAWPFLFVALGLMCLRGLLPPLRTQQTTPTTTTSARDNHLSSTPMSAAGMPSNHKNKFPQLDHLGEQSFVQANSIREL